jgi:hypothetical protein
MRTELMLALHQNEELACTETPRYIGRGVVALAADPEHFGPLRTRWKEVARMPLIPEMKQARSDAKS